MSEQCSEIFEEVFNSRVGGCVRDCACGQTYYDDYNDYDWEPGELENLKENSNAIPFDYSISTMSINNEEIVIGCDCGRAKKYEEFILRHAEQLAEYLNKKAEALKEKAESIKVKQHIKTRLK